MLGADVLNAGLSNSGTAGYMDEGAGASSTNAYKFPFSNQTFSSLGGILLNTQQRASMSNSGTAGYYGGSFDGSYKTTIQKLTFSNDTVSTLSATVSRNQLQAKGCGATGIAGYITPGAEGPSALSTIHRMSFSNDTLSTFSYPLDNRAWMNGLTNFGA